MPEDTIFTSSLSTSENHRIVAWLDIFGFKSLMRSDPDEALSVVKEFFKIGFRELHPRNQPPEREGDLGVNGLFVSDCGIIWSELIHDNPSCVEQFQKILKIVKNINEKVFRSEVMKRNRTMLSTSIAYGQFYPIPTKEHEHIDKKLIFGQAYIDAYTDNINLDPGLCRIVGHNLPNFISDIIANPPTRNLFSFIRQDEGQLYFYWNCSTLDEIETFRLNYKRAKEVKYREMYDAISTNYR